MNLSILPMQWTGLADLPDVPPVDDGDLDCLAEIRDVLARHGKLNRFAVHLAHRHFALGPDEILIERPDPDGRTQHVTVGTVGGRARRAPDHMAVRGRGASFFFQTRSIAFASPIRTRRTPASGMAGAARPAVPAKGTRQRSSGASRRKRTPTIAAFPSPATTKMSGGDKTLASTRPARHGRSNALPDPVCRSKARKQQPFAVSVIEPLSDLVRYSPFGSAP